MRTKTNTGHDLSRMLTFAGTAQILEFQKISRGSSAWPADYNDRGTYLDSRGGEFTSVADMIDRQFAPELDMPIAYGFPAGHGDVNFPLLMGADVTLTIENGTFSLTY